MDEQTLLRMLAGGQGTVPLEDVQRRQEGRKRLEDMMRGIMLGGGPAGPPGINGNPMAPMPQMGRGTGVPTSGGVTGVSSPTGMGMLGQRMLGEPNVQLEAARNAATGFAGSPLESLISKAGKAAGGFLQNAGQQIVNQPQYMQDAERALAVLRNAVEAQGPAPDPVAQRADMERNSMFQTDAARQAARQGLFDRNLKSLDRLTGATPELTGTDAERVAAAMGAPYRRESITASGPGWSVQGGLGSDWKQKADEAARLREIEGSKAAVEMLRQAARAKLASVKPETADLMNHGNLGQVDQNFRSQLAANRRADIAAREARGQAVLQQRYENSPEGRLRKFMLEATRAANPPEPGKPVEDDSDKLALALLAAAGNMQGTNPMLANQITNHATGMLGIGGGGVPATPAPPTMDPQTNAPKPQNQMLNDLVQAVNNGHITEADAIKQAEQYERDASARPNYKEKKGESLPVVLKKKLPSGVKEGYRNSAQSFRQRQSLQQHYDDQPVNPNWW